MTNINETLGDLARAFETLNPKEIIRQALERHDNIAISFSGAEDVVLIDLATKVSDRPVQVFSLDTGRLHPETYRYIERVRKHYGDRINLEVMYPQAEAVQAFVQAKGLYSFYEDGHQECCGVRKIEPLRRKLATLDAWITGQRRDQSPTRTDVPTVQADPAFRGVGETLTKYNPLAGWTSAQVWGYIGLEEVPYNELHERGMISIGCEPCTRPVKPTEHERAGRWWWEEATQRECGLHKG